MNQPAQVQFASGLGCQQQREEHGKTSRAAQGILQGCRPLVPFERKAPGKPQNRHHDRQSSRPAKVEYAPEPNCIGCFARGHSCYRERRQQWQAEDGHDNKFDRITEQAERRHCLSDPFVKVAVVTEREHGAHSQERREKPDPMLAQPPHGDQRQHQRSDSDVVGRSPPLIVLEKNALVGRGGKAVKQRHQEVCPAGTGEGPG